MLEKIFIPLRDFTSQIASIQRSFAAFEHIEELFIEPLEENGSSLLSPTDIKDKLSSFLSLKFNNVSFRYNESSPYVLSAVSFSLEKGEQLALVGTTGSGKSTTLAAMIGHRNRHSSSHILTIEDPLEFIHKHERSIVQQREVGIDTLSYGNALKNALREAPDVILIGEIRDMATMKYAISYAETGHLCLATLHSNNANQTMDRILNFFPEMAHRQLLMDLSLNLRAIISQRLLPTKNGGCIPAVEVMLSSPYIKELILKGQIGDIKEAMKGSADDGTVTFDQALLTLYREGKITLEDAIYNADSKNDLNLAIRMGKDEESGFVSKLIMG